LVNSPVTSIELVTAPTAKARELAMLGKKPIDFIMQQFQDTMELLMAYDLDENFVPSIDDLVLFEKLHTQLTRYPPISDIVVHRMRSRVRGIG
jgi:hypothetical protein